MNSSIQAHPARRIERPPEGPEARTSIESWLRRGLSERYDAVVQEPLPDALLRLLTAD
jgi:hypothetical protein